MQISAGVVMVLAIIILAVFYTSSCFAFPDTLRSDSAPAKTQPSPAMLLNAQLHSAGLFLATGEISNAHPSFDIYFAYDRKQWGLQAYKSLDMVDHTTDINYAIVVVDKHFNIGKNIIFTPDIGFELVQNTTLADKGSDVTVILNTAVKLTQHFAFNYEAIFQNVVITKEHNFTNRLRLFLTEKYIDVTAFLWDRNKMFNSSAYLSTGLNVGCSRIRLSPNLNLILGVTAMRMLSESMDTESFPKKNAIMVSIGCVFVK